MNRIERKTEVRSVEYSQYALEPLKKSFDFLYYRVEGIG